MAKVQHGMGRGLAALLGEEVDLNEIRKPVGYINKEVVTQRPSDTPAADVVRIPIDLIEPNPYQPRMSFDPEALQELADSIRSLGLIQPITVRRKDNSEKYQIISGERRFRACRLAGFDMIPAYTLSTNDQGMMEMAIVENIQREDLDPIEVALSYQRLIEECSLTQEQMALRVGKKRVSVTNTLRLLKLPAKVQHDLKVGLISVGHAKVLLSIDDAGLQETLCDAVIKGGLSVRQLEELVKKAAQGEKPATEESSPELPDNYYEMLEIVGKYFGNNISLRQKNGKGTMTIRFSGDEEINAFLSALKTIQQQ